MRHPQFKCVAAAGLSAMIGLSACSGNGTNSATSTSADSTVSMTSSMSPSASAAPASNLVGPGCAGYAQQVPTGPGSVAGMAADPVAMAASNNPILTTPTAALSGKPSPVVNLVDARDNGQYTIFAPTDDAFKKVPASTIDVKSANATVYMIDTVLMPSIQ